MPIQMLFSIIILTFNKPEILLKTLDYLEKQEVVFLYEVIVRWWLDYPHAGTGLRERGKSPLEACLEWEESRPRWCASALYV